MARTKQKGTPRPTASGGSPARGGRPGAGRPVQGTPTRRSQGRPATAAASPARQRSESTPVLHVTPTAWILRLMGDDSQSIPPSCSHAHVMRPHAHINMPLQSEARDGPMRDFSHCPPNVLHLSILIPTSQTLIHMCVSPRLTALLCAQRSPGTDRGRWRCGRYASTRRARSCSSGSCPSPVW